MTKSQIKFVVESYAKYFGRAADADTIEAYGLNENGKAEKTSVILKNIIADADAEKAELSTSDFVNNAFQNLFGRNATTKEMNKYSKVVEKGNNLPINSIVKSAAKADQAVNKNKLEVAAKYADLGGKGDLDLSKISKGNLVDLKTVTTLAALQAKYDALADNSGIPSSFDGKTFVLTTGVDTGKAFIGTAKNDLFVATAGTLTVADSIDGGKGTDGLTIVETALIRNATFENSTMKSIEIVDITSSALDTDGATAGNDSIILNTTTTGKVADNFKAVTDINLKATNATAASATIDATVSGTQNVTATANGTIKITGGKNIVAKTVGAITISDDNSVAGTAATIEKITIDGLAVASTIGATKSADALKELTVKNATANTLTVTTAVETLKVNFDNSLSTGNITLTDAKLKTLNVDASGKDSSVNFDATSTILETINISGNAKLTLLGTSDVTDAARNVKEINVTNTKGVVITNALDINTKFTGGAGADSVKIGATTKAISMGAGDDTVKLTTGVTVLGTGGSVDAGAGKDTISMDAADANTISGKVDGKFNSTFSNFEVLEISTATSNGDIIDVEKINNVSQVTFAAAATATTTINNLVSGGTVKLTTDTNNLTVNVKNVSTSTSDVLNLELSKNGILAAGTVKAAGVETININVADAVTTGSTAAIHTLTLDAADATSVVVTGNNGLTLTNANAKITTFDASGVVANGALDSDANLAVTFTSANITAGQAVTIIGGAGDDTLEGTAQANDTITGGKGIDTITYKGGKDSFTGGEGADKFVIGTKTAASLGTKDSYLTISDLGKGDSINVSSLTKTPATDLDSITKISVASSATFDQALNAAAAGDGNLAAGSIGTWFQFENNTYLVVDNGAGATYVNGTDSFIKIAGLVDLDAAVSTVLNGLITIA